MRAVAVAIIIAFLAVPAQAQKMRGKSRGGDTSPQTTEQKKKKEEQDRAYNDALRKIPDQKKADPWSNMR